MIGGTNAFTVRHAVFDLLRKFGIRKIFGNPGSTELPLFRDFPDDFDYVLALQEIVAVGMADGYAQATRNAAFLNLHSAAGLGHAMGGLFTAYRNGTPLIVTAGQQARSILPYNPFLFAEDPTVFPKPYVKWAVEPARAEDVPAAIARAYYIAMQPPTGPAFVSIPVDDWDKSCDPLEPRQVSRSISPDDSLIEQVRIKLSRASRPALVLGAAVAWEDAWADVVGLAEAYRAAVWMTAMCGRNGFPEDHPLFAGFLSARREAIHSVLGAYDVVVSLGAPVFTYHVEGAGPIMPEGTSLFHLTDDPHAASLIPVGTSILTSLKPALGRLHRLSGIFEGDLKPLRDPPEPVPADPLTDSYCLQQVARRRPADAIIVEEAPSSRSAMHKHLPITIADGFHTCASGGLGHGLPAAIGIALGKPGRRVIAILGDGSALYAIQGLYTASKLDLPVSFIILNNRRYEALEAFGRLFGLDKPVGTSIGGVDFVKIAEAQGVPATRVEVGHRLDEALENSFAKMGPSLVEVAID